MNLHELNPKHPYPQVPLLTGRVLERIGQPDEEGDGALYVYGLLYDIWREDKRAYALFGMEDSTDRYIVRYEDFDDRQYGYSIRDLRGYRAQMQQEPNCWEASAWDYNLVETRPPFNELTTFE